MLVVKWVDNEFHIPPEHLGKGWAQRVFVPGAPPTFVGQGGECLITIHINTLQDGRVDILVVHSRCDNFIHTAHHCVPYQTLETEVNSMIASFLNRG